MADSIKIQVDVLAKDAAKELDKFLNNIKFQTLQLETAFKKGTISSAELSKGLTKLESDVKSYGVSTLKTETTIRALTNAQLRAKEGFTSLGGKLNEISGQQKQTNAAFISFNQILQDAPFGIRGVGNNIQFLTQQFTQLRASGMSTGQILKGMLQNALTPMGGLMLGVSVATSALTFAMDLLGQESDNTTEKVKNLNDEIERNRRAISDVAYRTGVLSESEYRSILQSRTQTAKRGLLSAIPGAGIMGLSDKDLLKPIDIIMKNVAGGIDSNIEKTKELTDRQREYIDALSESAQFEERITKEKEQQLKKIKMPKVLASGLFLQDDDAAARRKAAFELEERNQKLLTEIQASEFERREHIAEMGARKQEQRQKQEQENLRDLQRAYNSMFFDPVSAGFRALGNEIFGTQSHLQNLKNSFGNVAAAIIQSLEGVIMKLAETAASAAILGLLFPGSGLSFAQRFLGLSGLGSSATPSIASTGSTGAAIASASRRAQQSRSQVFITGEFRQRGSDMVAVVEVNQLKRNTRSMKVSR